MKVFHYDYDEDLPFGDEKFELIINRHESYSPIEVFRLLKPGGIFITQQVGVNNDSKLRFILTNKENFENNVEWKFENVVKKLELAGFQITESQENITPTRIYDVGAIVYYLKAIPWELPGFSVEKYYGKLVEIHNHIINHGYLDLDGNNHRFLISAKKPVL